MLKQNYINHVGLVLDESSSMADHKDKLVQVADEQVRELADMSQALDQETRISLYSFAYEVKNLDYDKDVLRLPSIKGRYKPSGRTALIDATLRAVNDLEQTATLYGDHAFLLFVLTDGKENESYGRPNELNAKLKDLPDNWTVATLVPNSAGVYDATRFGFPANNIAIWDADSATGIDDAATIIRTATSNFMHGRSQGIRGTRNLFSTGLDTVNTQTVRSNLDPLSRRSYAIYRVHQDSEIRSFVESKGIAYYKGVAFYQLTKREKIQPQKQVAIREKSTGQVFSGENARDLLNLPHGIHVEVRPNHNPLYDVFVQSTSTNRKLIANTDVLVLR